MMNGEASGVNKRETIPVVFDEFTFNFFPLWLKRNNIPVKISPKTGLILHFLIVNQHATITSEQIKSHCWPSLPKTHSFGTAINLLRTTLDDSRKEGTRNDWRLITNPQTGVYALGVKVTLQSTPIDYIGIFKKLSLASVLVAGVAAAAIEIVKPSIYQRSASQSLTTLNGNIQFSVAVSPEKTLVFSHAAPWAKEHQLMVMRWNEQAKPLLMALPDSTDKPLDLNNVEASFSPSGTQLAWVRTDFSSYCDVMIADFNSTTLTVSNLKSVKECNSNYFARSPQWRGEKALLVSLPLGQNRPNNIFEIDLLTDETFQLTSTTGEGVGDYGLYYNADADKMVYLRYTTSSANTATEVKIYDFNSQQNQTIKSYVNPLYSVAWKDRNHLVVKGQKGFELLNLNGKSFSLGDKSEQFEYFPFSLGKDEVGYVKGSLYAGNIQTVDLLTGTVDSSLSSIAQDYRPVIAKDSNVVVYASRKNGVVQLFISSNTLPITKFAEETLIADLNVSYDGKFVAYVKNNELNLITDNGVLLHSIKGAFTGLSFTPIGDNLVYSKINRFGDNEIVKLSLSDFSEQKLTEGYSPIVTANNDIYYFKALKNKTFLHKITPSFGVSKLIEVAFTTGNSTSFEVINDDFYYVENISNELYLVAKNLKNGEIKKIIKMESTRFSINRTATKLVTTKKAAAQNNIEFFSISKM